MTNYSKNLGLNVVRTRPLPEVGLLNSNPSTPKSKHKGFKGRNKDGKGKHGKSKSKLSQISGIYESEPGTSRMNRSKAFGYPVLSLSTLEEKEREAHSVDSRNLSRKIGKKVKNRKKALEKQALEERKQKFRALDLNARPDRDKIKLAQKKARKRLAKRVTDYSFFLDYESPYAEYLPARYREWQPKEPKKPENNFVNPEEIHRLEDKLDEVSMIYNKDAPGSHNGSVMHSRAGSRIASQKPKRYKPQQSKFGSSQYLDPSERLSKRPAKSQKRKKEADRLEPIMLDDYDSSLNDSDNEHLKIFHPSKKNKVVPISQAKYDTKTPLVKDTLNPMFGANKKRNEDSR